MVPMGTHEWNRYLNAEDIENIIAPEGLKAINKAGVMVSNPLTMEMKEFPNWLRGNYLMMTKKE